MSGLVVKDLRKSIADFELRASFSVSPSERLALLGRSGSGKTSLLRLIAGLDPIISENLTLNAVDLLSLSPEKRNIGFVFQDQELFPSMNVLENASFGLQVRGMAREVRHAHALEWLKKVGLGHLAGASIEKLSGGERQRIAVIRALIWRPNLLLLDEPFSALDREIRQRLISDILHLLSERPIPVVLVTHELADVEVFATRRIALREDDAGKVRYFND